jgi:L-threonylcarbamoyladenylate synthase
VSPTTAAHVAADLGADVDLVLDGGPCEVGIESTIVDVSGGEVVVLRPGHVTPDEIAAAAGVPIAAGMAGAPRAPGTLEAHYAPRTSLALVESAALGTRPPGGRLALYVFTPPAWAVQDIVRVAPPGAVQYAHHLYAALRELDESGAEQIVVEAPPGTAEWSAVVDRLRRASRGSAA